MVVYSLAKEFNISPMQVYEMPSNMVMDFLSIHATVEGEKAKEMDKQIKSHKSKVRR